MNSYKLILLILLISGFMTSNVLSKSISICVSNHYSKNYPDKKVKNDKNCHNNSSEKKITLCFECDCHLIHIQKIDYINFLTSANFTSHLNYLFENFYSLNLKIEDPPPRFFS